MRACPLVVLACESLHVCTVCIWRCEHARFFILSFMRYIHIFIDSFIHIILGEKVEKHSNSFQLSPVRYRVSWVYLITACTMGECSCTNFTPQSREQGTVQLVPHRSSVSGDCGVHALDNSGFMVVAYCVKSTIK